MDEQQVDLRQVVSALWRHKLLISAITLILSSLAYFVSSGQAPVYEASSRMVLQPLVPPASFGASSVQGTGPLGLELAPESQAEVIQSVSVATGVRDALRLDDDPADLAASIQVTIVTNELLEITAASFSPSEAAQLADAFAAEFIEYRRRNLDVALEGLFKDLVDRMEYLTGQVDGLDKKIIALIPRATVADSASASASQLTRAAEAQSRIDRLRAERNALLERIGDLRGRLEDVRQAATTSSGGGIIIERASIPAFASSPRPARATAMGIVLGLLFGMGLAFLREYFDDRIRSRQDAVRASSVPVVAAVPRTRAWRKRKLPYLATLADPGSASAESYRTLRQSLTAMGLGRTIRSVLITSGGARAGKSVTAANLSVACAQAGLRVVVVSADLRRPRLHEFFGIDNPPGLNQVLSGEGTVEGTLVPTVVPGLSLLPSGPAPHNPAELLDGGHLDRVLTALLDEADVVIIDAPPIASGADSMVLAAHVDLSVLAMRCGAARASGVASALGSLAQAGAVRQVAVLNMAVEDEARSYIPVPKTYAPLHVSPADNGHGDAGLNAAAAAGTDSRPGRKRSAGTSSSRGQDSGPNH